MNSFFRDVIAKLITAEFQGHTSFKVADNKAVGDNPVRELHLDAVPVNDDQSIISLAWDGGNKLFEKTLPSEEAKHNFELISSDMSEAVSLTSNGKIDEAKKLMESLVNKYSEQSGEIVPTNLPPTTTTQAAMNCPHCPHAINEHHTGCEAKGCRCEMTPYLIKNYKESSKDEFAGLWKQAKVSLRNIFPSGTIQDLSFDTQEELSEYQNKMKELNPQDRIPLWDMDKGKKAPEGEESTDIAPPSLSYDQIEKEKEKEHKNLEKSIDEKIKTEVESALIEKAATVFGPDQIELVKVLRKNGRNWDEIKKILVKDFNFDKEATTIFVDDLRSKEEGTPVEEPMPEAPKPPENLVSPETHDKLLEDLDKPVDEKKSEPPVKEEKEPGLSPKDIMGIPEEKESAQKCPKCGEDVWDVAGGGMTGAKLNKCWNCGTAFDSPEMEEIARADNAEIRKVAMWQDRLQNVYDSLEDFRQWDEMYGLNERLGFPSIEEAWAANPLIQGSTKPADFKVVQSSLNKEALNPLQEPPVVETPTAETSNQDIVPISKTPNHDIPKKGDRVFVMSDLGEEKAGFEGTYVSEYSSKGNQYAIIETDEKDLLDVEMHRVSKVSENTSPEPSIEPNVQKPEEPEIDVTPKMEDLHSSLKEASKEDACYLCGKPSTHSFQGGKDDPRTGKWCDECYKKQTEKAEKEASLEDIKVEVKKLEAQLNKIEKEASDSFRSPVAVDMYGEKELLGHEEISFMKEVTVQWSLDLEMREWGVKSVYITVPDQAIDLQYEYFNPEDDSYIPESKKVQISDVQVEGLDRTGFDGLAPQTLEYHEGKWTLDFGTSQHYSSKYPRLIRTSELPPEHICERCKKPMGYQGFISPICGKCVREQHKKVTGTEKQVESKKEYKPCPYCGGLSSSEDVCLNCLKPLKKQAADPVLSNPTQLKDVKITPDYVQKEKAVPASPEQSEVIAKMQAIEANLSTLDRTKEEVKAKLTAELKRIDDAGERASLEAEYKNQIEKLSILIDAVDSKLIKYNDMFYAFQQGETKVVPKLTPKELLEKIYKRFSEAEKFVQDVTNGMLSLAKSVTTRTLTRWPEKRSELSKEASVSDELASMNQQMLEALNLLSEPLA